MNDAGAVRELKGGQNTLGVTDCLWHTDRALVQQVAQQGSANVFHDDIGGAAFVAVRVDRKLFASVIDTHDGWVSHAGRSLSLLSKASLERRVVGQV